tara:strand:+ start:10032 stop:10565 length:534 start_codon:yes stop_codon:yes gene_type:complete
MSAEKVTISILNRSELAVVLPTDHFPGVDQDEQRTIHSTKYGLDQILRTGSTPSPTEALVVAITLGASPYSFDLESAPIIGADSSGSPAATEDLTGNKLFHFEAEAPSTNNGNITIDPTVTNGYTLFGAGNDLVLPPNSKIGFTCLGSNQAVVSSTVKAIDVSGTNGDKCNIIIGFE